jgi:uncharacterized membrane protein
MEIKTLFGLPAHPLLVHIPVVLIPLVGIATIVIALSARARRSVGWVVVALAAVAFVGTILAAGSGEQLEDSVPSSPALTEHTEHAANLRPLAFVLLLSVLAIVLIDRRVRRGASPPRLVPVAAALVAIVLAVTTTGYLVSVGHSGAEATWKSVHIESDDAHGGGH